MVLKTLMLIIIKFHYQRHEIILAHDNQKLPKLLSKGFERSVHWNESKTKSESRNMTNK